MIRRTMAMPRQTSTTSSTRFMEERDARSGGCASTTLRAAALQARWEEEVADIVGLIQRQGGNCAVPLQSFGLLLAILRMLAGAPCPAAVASTSRMEGVSRCLQPDS